MNFISSSKVHYRRKYRVSLLIFLNSLSKHMLLVFFSFFFHFSYCFTKEYSSSLCMGHTFSTSVFLLFIGSLFLLEQCHSVYSPSKKLDPTMKYGFKFCTKGQRTLNIFHLLTQTEPDYNVCFECVGELPV